MFNKTKFLSFYIGTQNEKNASDCYDAIEKSLTDLGIYSELTQCGAMATIRVECGKSFKPVEENYIEKGRVFVGAQYEGRIDLGNNVVGDGNKFRGRGLIQLTGRTNYTQYSNKFNIDLVCEPDLVLQLDISAKILAQYFKDRGVYNACNDQNWALVRLKVNGGSNGLQDFLNIINQYLK